MWLEPRLSSLGNGLREINTSRNFAWSDRRFFEHRVASPLSKAEIAALTAVIEAWRTTDSAGGTVDTQVNADNGIEEDDISDNDKF
jgi:uncharacterized protein YqfA (UPF0365 family)